MGRIKANKPHRRPFAQAVEGRMARAVFETDRRENMQRMFDDIFGEGATEEEIAQKIVSGNLPIIESSTTKPQKENA